MKSDVFCEKLSQWLGDRQVCMRRQQIPAIYKECVGCNYSPLQDIPKFVGSRMVFNDPPKGGYKVWRSGNKLVGDPEEIAKIGEDIPVSQPIEISSPLPSPSPTMCNPAPVDKIGIEELITEESRN